MSASDQLVIAEASDSSHESILQKRLMEKHKKMFTSVVMPVIIGTTFLLLVSHWRNDAKFYYGLATILFLDVFNIVASAKNWQIRSPFGMINTRSDGFDTFRWCINLVLDVFVAYSLQLSVASSVAIWLILSFGAMTEVFNWRNRLITLGVATACFAVILYSANVKWIDFTYLMSCYAGLIFILLQLERWILTEMTAYSEEIRKREEEQRLSDSLVKEAIIGSQARMIVHEVNNMLFIIKNASIMEKISASSKDSKNIARIDRSVEILSKLSKLVLDDMPARDETFRMHSFDDLSADIKLLMVKHFSVDDKIKITMIWEPFGQQCQFKELPGTTYLIIHNMVKNATEALAEKYKGIRGGEIEITSRKTGDGISVSVRDNGPGLDAAKIAAIKNETATTSKFHGKGHGLGLRFTVQYIRKNGFQFEIESEPGLSTNLSLIIPAIWVKDTTGSIDLAG